MQFPESEAVWFQPGCNNGCHLGSEEGCYIRRNLGSDAKDYSFATVPLWGKGKVIGMILVDNLYNKKPITDEDLKVLTMFSNQAGLAIENALLYRNLEEVHQELKETQNLLVHQEKMVALGEMSASIAHEIKNPLVSIGGFARRLDRTIPDEAPEKRYAQTIMEEVLRLEKILNDLYQYTRDEIIEFKECDLRHILEDSLMMISGQYRTTGIKVVKEFTKDLPKVYGDHHQLKQAFSNLINNSYQAMKEEGTLYIRVYPFTEKDNSYIRIELEDTGMGIDPENLPNIFNPFYTTKESTLGLGLPIVHKIITNHHGQIEVNNRPGKGVTFIITFQAQDAKQS
jgi:signal transduction histidine kinase